MTDVQLAAIAAEIEATATGPNPGHYTDDQGRVWVDGSDPRHIDTGVDPFAGCRESCAVWCAVPFETMLRCREESGL